VLNGVGETVIKSFGIDPATKRSLAHSEDEIKIILSESAQSGVIDEKEVEMVDKVFKAGHIHVKKIMVPQKNIVCFSILTHFKDVAKATKESIHTRFPVWLNTSNNIIGFLHVKDIHKIEFDSHKEKRLFETNLVHDILKVKESKRIIDVLFALKEHQTHIAVVVNTKNQATGIITLDDIVESLVGQMQDEFNQPIYNITEDKDGNYIVGGLALVKLLQERFNILKNEEPFNTVEGVFYGLFGANPKVGETVEVDNVLVTIRDIKAKRIQYIKISHK
ncbi:MAG: transporter associated domain-containing protein, partial [Candidatus Levyibacteriota bacterium]